MSRQRIRWIVALMAIGLLGLVGLQLYWIGSAFRLQREQFTYKVTDALQEVVRTLERQEIAYQAKEHIQAREQQSKLMAIAKKDDKHIGKAIPEPPVATAPVSSRKTDVTSAKRKHDMPTSGAVVVQSDVLHPSARPLSAEQMTVMEQFFQQQEELIASGDWQTQLAQQQQFDNWVENILTDELTRINSQVSRQAQLNDSLHRARRKARKLARQQAEKESLAALATTPGPVAVNSPVNSHTAVRTQEQSRMIKAVLKGLLLSDRPIEDRINRIALDTLLQQALSERGISIPFDYAVRTRQQPRFLFTSMGGGDTQSFEVNGYKAALFPNNLLETGNYVYVFFPTQQQFILNRLGFTFGASAVLILIILACFYIAISTIVQQKKLADIKNDFINNMTHEFKTPISTISLAVEMAQEQLRSPDMLTPTLPGDTDTGKPGSRIGRYMGIIRDETQRLGSHVEKVLQMALLDRGEIRLKLSSVNIHDVIEKVLNNIGLQIEQRGGTVDLNFDAEDEVIEADELHVTNIINNLVDNALKYSPDPPHIVLSTHSTSEGVTISVADRGIGMTKEQVNRIFEKFYRVPTGNRHDVKGFGLGLSYVKKMIDEHHGQIQVESQPGKGSTFEIFLPFNIGERVKE